jgi:UPF0271 protein
MVNVHINCDVGEQDMAPRSVDLKKVAPYISSINIACGFHAGSATIISEAIDIAKKFQLEVGAHPSYNDRRNFGRKVIETSDEEIFSDIIYQVGAVRALSKAKGINLNHVKPHGALYNETSRNPSLCKVVYEAIKSVHPSLKVYGLPETAHEETARIIGLTFVAEGFGDRKYQTRKSLMSRQIEGSVLTDPTEAIYQVDNLWNHSQINTSDEGMQRLKVDTICIHGDSVGAEELLKSIYEFFV